MCWGGDSDDTDRAQGVTRQQLDAQLAAAKQAADWAAAGKCPSCGNVLRYDDKAKQFRCSGCG